jgi:hypothetical protein
LEAKTIAMKWQSLTAMAVLGGLGLLTQAKADDRLERLARLRAAKIDSRKLQEFVAHYRGVNRGALQAEGLLGCLAPEPGGMMIAPAHRSVRGERLLTEAKDLLFALLFGDAQAEVRLDRTERELLSLIAPRAKARALEFLQASTELSAAGTWKDPTNKANDSRAENVIIEVEYGETADEMIGHGIVTALRLINLLELNEQVLYARMTNVEQSTLN